MSQSMEFEYVYKKVRKNRKESIRLICIQEINILVHPINNVSES